MVKILSIDVETKPSIAYVWGAYDINISPEQVIEPGGIMCFAAKWVGQKHMFFASEWTHTREEMFSLLYSLLAEADAVITYNGDRFDLPKIRGEFVLLGMVPPPPVTSIDVLKVVKKFGFMINKLAFIGPLLGVGAKLQHQGFGLWRSVLEGDIKALKRMERYNKQDVIVLENLYKRVQPYIVDHPHLGDEKGLCGSCGSDHLHHRGYRRTKYFKTERLQCQECGSWSTGKRLKIQ